jgi:L-lactate dehydrogenase complex protein LldG
VVPVTRLTDVTDARDEILARVRSALTDRPRPAPAVRDYDGAGAHPAEPGALLDLLEERLVDYRAEVRRAARDDVATAVGGALARHGAGRVVVPAGYPVEWLEPWLERSGGETVGDSPPLSPAELDGLDGVVTTCRLAIATTGTLVLDGGPGQGRRALSLVPDLHVVVVDAADVVRNVPDALPLLDPHRPATWISGPSATSDIELSRIEGVHGPRRLEVVLRLP